jgi:hypothetical protein
MYPDEANRCGLLNTQFIEQRETKENDKNMYHWHKARELQMLTLV